MVERSPVAIGRRFDPYPGARKILSPRKWAFDFVPGRKELLRFRVGAKALCLLKIYF